MKAQMLVGMLVLALLIAATAGLGQAQGSGSESKLEPGRAASPAGAADIAQRGVGAAIPYAGRLQNGAGQPVAEGAYDFTFALYAPETGGEPLWSEVQAGVTVRGGSFSVSLGSGSPIPPAVLDGGTLWLAVGVRGPGEAGFTALTPRQRVSAAAPASLQSPAANAACPHDHFGEHWTGSTGDTGLWITTDAVDDIGLRVDGASFGVYVESPAGAGVQVDSPGNIGVWVTSAHGDGVVANSVSSSHFGGHFANMADGGGGLYARLGGNSASDDDGRIYSDPAYTGSDILLVSNDAVQLEMDNDNNEAGHFWLLNGANTTVFSVNESGDMVAIGTKSAGVTTQDYGQRKLYAVESPEVWFEDFGRAQLVDGAATVVLEPVFAQTVNLETYHVYLSAVCQEPVLLFVTQQIPAAFTVQGVTLDGQPSQCAFDYRLVARRLGYENVRLEPGGTDLDAEGDAP
jgi:hypothetical protein